jgi:hypothetical protein
VPVGTLLTLEYERLKEEQKTRIGMRDNLIYVTIAAMAVVIAATIQSGGRADLLLLLPPVPFLLGWTYLVNDEKISSIGRYIRHHLAPALAALTGSDIEVFGWEGHHHDDMRRRSRKVMQLVVDLTAFCVVPTAAVVVFWAAGPIHPALLLVSLVETVALGVLASFIVRYAGLRQRPIEIQQRIHRGPVAPDPVVDHGQPDRRQPGG